MRYAIAAASALLALVVERTIFPRPDIAPFIVAAGGVALTSWLGGQGPGLVATALSAVLANYFFLAPYNSFTLTGPGLLATMLFAVVGIAISVLSGSLRMAIAETEKTARLLSVALSEHREAQESAHRSEERMRLAQTAARLGVYDHDLRAGTIEWDERMREFWGVAPTVPVTWELFMSAVHPDDRLAIGAAIERAHLSHGNFEFEYRVTNLRDGVERWVKATGHVSFEHDRPVRHVGTVEDVSARKRAELALEDRETQLRDAQRLAGLGSWEWTVGSNSIAWSEGLHLILGRDLKLGAPTFEALPKCYPPKSWERLRAAITRAIEAGAPYELDLEMIREDGTTRWVTTRGEAVRGPSGAVVKLRGTAHDITERKRAEQEHARLATILETTSDFVATADPSGRALYYNRAAKRLLGIGEDEDYSKVRIADTHPAWANAIVLDEGIPTAIRENIWSGETALVSRDGREIPVSQVIISHRAPDGSVEYFSTIARDITERKRAEQEREQLVAALREADQRKNEFLGVLSHELRNPLTPIRTSLYILERVTPGGEQARRAQSVIDRQVSHLARLVDDLLDVTRISRGKIRLQRTRLDFVDLARRTVEDHRASLEDHEIAIELPNEVILMEGDPTRLAQVIGNLLTNAAKFTPADGKISVSLKRAEGRAVLEVADTGIGIDHDTLQRLFEPFAQADRSLARSRGGLGLGLALVKGLVELHGGMVGAQSDGPGKGARFTVTIPLDEQVAVAASPEPAQDVTGARQRVLIIEDNKDVADTLVETLELWGHQVTAAYDGETGVATAGEFRPEVVLCDIGLPAGMDGYAVARALRRGALTASAYLVALTGYAQPEDKNRALDAGFDAHLAKPPDLAALQRLLGTFTHDTHAGHEAARP